MFNLHATIPLTQHVWDPPVSLATDKLHAEFPAVQTRVYDGRRGTETIDLVINLAGQGAPTAALTIIQRLGARLNPQGLTRVEVADNGADQAPWTGYYAYGPSTAVAAWLAEQAALDTQLRFTGPVSLHLRYEETPA
ncbi:MAG: hypothetical protein NT169_19925 [Chloroflexi bacterium]|nr:hypothetical protein [Chloroflexota bacterium]